MLILSYTRGFLWHVEKGVGLLTASATPHTVFGDYAMAPPLEPLKPQLHHQHGRRSKEPHPSLLLHGINPKPRAGRQNLPRKSTGGRPTLNSPHPELCRVSHGPLKVEITAVLCPWGCTCKGGNHSIVIKWNRLHRVCYVMDSQHLTFGIFSFFWCFSKNYPRSASNGHGDVSLRCRVLASGPEMHQLRLNSKIKG